MTTKAFNWDYRACNAYGTSHVNDSRPVPYFGQQLEQPLRASEATHLKEREEFFKRNPHLLSNVHA